MLTRRELDEALEKIQKHLQWMNDNIEDNDDKFVWICNKLGISADDCVEVCDRLIHIYQSNDDNSLKHLIIATLWHGMAIGRAAKDKEKVTPE